MHKWFPERVRIDDGYCEALRAVGNPLQLRAGEMSFPLQVYVAGIALPLVNDGLVSEIVFATAGAPD